MVERLRKTRNVFWILCAITFVFAITGSVFVRYNQPGIIHNISFVDYLMVIPNLFLGPIFDEHFLYTTEIAISYLLLMVPVIFACIAIVLGKIAKAFDEQTIATMNLLNETKSKQEQK